MISFSISLYYYPFTETLGHAKHLRAGVVFVDHIPKLGVRKIDRKYFKKLANNEIIAKSQ